MKLNLYQLEPHLKANLSPIYIVSGDEIMLKQDAINMIRKCAKQAGFSERIRITPEAGYDWESLHTTFYANSLLAEKRIIELDFRDNTPHKTAAKILEEYASKPVNDNVLLIDVSKVDDKIARSAWYKALEKNGVVITVWPIPREQLPQWITQRAQKYKLQINLNAANFLADYVEGNLVAAAQAIEKIYLLKHEGTIDNIVLEKILTDESRFTIFDFIDHFISGNKQKALQVLTNLQNDGTETVLLLWVITRELRMLAEMAQQLQQGVGYDTLFQKHRIFAKRQTTVRKFLSRFKAEHCWDMLTQATHIDHIIKGAAPGNAWEALELFCLRV